MRIAIVTVYDSIVNYGSFLQAYALSKVLESMGHEVFFVRRMSDEKIRSRFDEICKEQNKIQRGSKFKAALLKVKSQIIIEREKKANLVRYQYFKKDWEHFSIIDKEELKEEKIDLLICGSDEIWNLSNKDIDIKFYGCDWVHNIPKLAYAISTGDTRTEEFLKYPGCFDAFGDFDRILPRDSMTEALVEKITGELVPPVCDPTILLGKTGYQITGCGKEYGKYMLVYSYYFTSREKEYIKRYAKENHLKIISPCIYTNIADENIYISSMDFPSLIANAECVFTTTFHGTIFSLMFAKKMCCSPRLPKVENLLEQCGAEKYALSKMGNYDLFCEVIGQSVEHDAIDNAMSDIKRESQKSLEEAICDIQLKGHVPLGNRYKETTEYYYGFSRNEQDVRRQSSSGGLFYELANKTIENKGVAFGAVYNPETKKVEHKSTEEVSLKLMLRSKYTESDLGDCFKKIEYYLTKERNVLFCGTPCQTAGLNQFVDLKLKKYKDHLTTVDFLCEGVPSAMIFKAYQEDIEKKKHKKIQDVIFRSKYYGWNVHCMKIVFNDGTQLIRPSFADPYMHSFIMDLLLNRPSCYQCKFREHKISDITIGDFWKVEQVDDTCRDNKGISAIFVHTLKGKELMEQISDRLVIHQLREENIAQMQQHLDILSYYDNRNRFYNEFLKKGFQEAIDKYSTYIGNSGILKRLKMVKLWFKYEIKRSKDIQ